MFCRLARICLFVVVSSLISCSSHQSADYFLLHPETIESSYDQCALLKPPFQTAECQDLLRAIPILKNYLLELIQQPGEFGLGIMSIEMKIVQLQKIYELYQSQHVDLKLLQPLRQEIEKRRLDLKVRFAVMRLVFKMARS